MHKIQQNRIGWITLSLKFNEENVDRSLKLLTWKKITKYNKIG